MHAEDQTPSEQRVLLLAPTLRDAQITCALLIRAGFACTVCENLPQLSQEAALGAGAILITEEAVNSPGIENLIQTLRRQPPWSDLPIVILMQGGVQSPAATRALRSLRNVTLLERPAPTRSVVSAVGAAVRGRQRQYQLRDQFAAIQRAKEEREQLLQSEQFARAESERAGRMKDEFLATLSHELRTPLNAILGWSQLIRRGNDPALIDEGISVIERNARMQVQLIEDLLDMSRIISGKIRLDVQSVQAASFVNAAVETVQPAAEAKGIRLETLLDPNAGPINGDPNRLQQVVWNLVSNAIKFTPKGGKIQILLRRVNSHIQITISDTGQGIKPEFLPHVFERFRQADASTTRSHGGLGLGLAIVKHLVELHGGSVAVTSRGQDQGSTFTVELPLSVVQHDQPEEIRAKPHSKRAALTHRASTSLQGKKILVVDDEPDARVLIRRVLEDGSATVVTAASAAEALTLIESEKPDILLSDIGMPLVDGYELLRRVRALGADRGGKIPAIALTAFARSEDRTRALLAGYLVHVSKPVEPLELMATVATVAGRTGEDA